MIRFMFMFYFKHFELCVMHMPFSLYNLISQASKQNTRLFRLLKEEKKNGSHQITIKMLIYFRSTFFSLVIWFSIDLLDTCELFVILPEHLLIESIHARRLSLVFLSVFMHNQHIVAYTIIYCC